MQHRAERVSLLGVAFTFWAVRMAAATTVAYWQFDDDGVSDFRQASVGSSAVYDLNSSAGATPSQSADVAANQILNPDATAGFLGDPESNGGSLNSLTPTESPAYLFTAGNASTALSVQAGKHWTIEGWFQAEQAPGANFDILWTTRDSDVGTFKGLQLALLPVGGTQKLQLFVDGGNTGTPSVTFDPEVTLNEWHHVALTFDGPTGVFDLYYDGESSGSLALGAVNRNRVDNNAGVLRLAGRVSGGVNNFGGQLDEWRISDAVLSPDEFLFVAVPEPSALLLLLMGVVLCSRRRSVFC